MFRRLTFQRTESLVQSEAVLTSEGSQKNITDKDQKKNLRSKSRKKGSKTSSDGNVSLSCHIFMWFKELSSTNEFSLLFIVPKVLCCCWIWSAVISSLQYLAGLKKPVSLGSCYIFVICSSFFLSPIRSFFLFLNSVIYVGLPQDQEMIWKLITVTWLVLIILESFLDLCWFLHIWAVQHQKEAW